MGWVLIITRPDAMNKKLLRGGWAGKFQIDKCGPLKILNLEAGVLPASQNDVSGGVAECCGGRARRRSIKINLRLSSGDDAHLGIDLAHIRIILAKLIDGVDERIEIAKGYGRVDDDLAGEVDRGVGIGKLRFRGEGGIVGALEIVSGIVEPNQLNFGNGKRQGYGENEQKTNQIAK